MTRTFKELDNAVIYMENCWYPTTLIRVEDGWMVIVER